jgi:hypothetical protein
LPSLDKEALLKKLTEVQGELYVCPYKKPKNKFLWRPPKKTTFNYCQDKKCACGCTRFEAYLVRINMIQASIDRCGTG